MATVYNVEPQPTGKVLLRTTAGDIVLELFAKQTPLASRNFLQHCIDGYYDNTLFHRLIPGFILQGGDPTGLGTGGESIYENGAPFADEFHSRLRFNRRGLLGMANTGGKDENASQFFLTLGKTEELNGKNTMFGRVEGDTIYNLMKLGEAELAEEGGDRPLYPGKVLGAEILVNPFADMVKREKVEKRTAGDGKGKKKRKAAKGGLSFGDEEDMAPVVKKAKVNPSFTAAPAAPAATEKTEKPKARRRTPTPSLSPEPVTRKSVQGPPSSRLSTSPSPPPSPEPETIKKMSALERTNAEIAALKQSMKRTTAPVATVVKPKSALEAMIPATSTRGRKRGKAGADGDGALDVFRAFQARLDAVPASVPSEALEANGQQHDSNDAADTEMERPQADGEEEETCDLHFIVNCQSCRSWNTDGKDETNAEYDDNDAGWMAHKLSFAKDTLGKDLEWKKKMEEYEVIDSKDKGGKVIRDEDRRKRDRDREFDAGDRRRKGHDHRDGRRRENGRS